MAPKEKALELYLKFVDILNEVDTHQSIRQEAIDSADYLIDQVMESMDMNNHSREFWYDVKYQLSQLDTILL